MERENETLSTRDLLGGGSVDEPGVGGGMEPPGGQTHRFGEGQQPQSTPGDPATGQNVGGQAAAGPAPGAGAGPGVPDAGNEPLLAGELGISFQSRWEEIQTRFVDEPRAAVEGADSLVASLMRELAESFSRERERLEAQWGRGEDISTEDLRVALQRYRSFFHRLLST